MMLFSRREMLKRGAQPVLRENYKTDNGNLILDCHAEPAGVRTLSIKRL
jgi:ribose 5-phosphate isomerase